MSLPVEIATDLTTGPVVSFADWPNPAVPTFGAGVYTVWHFDGRFIYVGMSGRGITADTRRRNAHVSGLSLGAATAETCTIPLIPKVGMTWPVGKTSGMSHMKKPRLPWATWASHVIGGSQTHATAIGCASG